jgi:myo-inositol-1(or 4)-monophosphatase
MKNELEPSANELRAVCESAARAGAEELLAWRGRFKTRSKGPADLVTDADLASQAAIRAKITASYPDHAFIGEEQETAIEALKHDRFVWLVDPLDGTTNYVHGYPCYAVSVAVAKAGELLAGVIIDPLAEECFVAAKGIGSWLNGDRLQTSSTTTAAEALVAVSLPPRIRRDAPDMLDFIRAAQFSQAVRRSGSAAINLAYVACGRLDAFWATQIHAWDVAAGVLLIREAGGVVTGRDGGPFSLAKPHFVSAASAELHGELLRGLSTSET